MALRPSFVLSTIALILSAQNIPIEKEAALGAHMAAEIRRTNPPIESDAVQQYIERIGMKLSAHFPDARFPFTFSVVRDDLSPAREARPIPGGYVFVPAGLILAAKNEEEVARMLAHAMVHVARRHGIREGATFASVPLIFIGSWNGSMTPLGFQREWQKFEAEADAIAAEITADVAFDSSGAELSPVQDELRRLTTVLPIRPPRPPTLRRPGEAGR